MIITKTPLRISFAGGGTDLPAFYERQQGAVVSCTIDLYVYLAVHRFFDPKIMLKYSRSEEVDSVEDIEHPLIRECMKFAGCDDNVEITSFADIPSRGSGLGSSSAFAAGLIKALHAFKGENVSAETCAAGACEVEIDRLGEPIGKQDQYAAAYGGVNFIAFNPDGSVEVDPIIIPREGRKYLEDHLVMFYTGITRSASGILAEQKANTEDDEEKFQTLCKMRGMADELRELFLEGKLDQLGKFLHKGWELKRGLASKISTGEIDEIYNTAMANGAEGGKLLGAGGGGFFLFFVPPERRAGLIESLSEYRCIEPHLDQQGSRIIYVDD